MIQRGQLPMLPLLQSLLSTLQYTAGPEQPLQPSGVIPHCINARAHEECSMLAVATPQRPKQDVNQHVDY